jgi:ribosomal protein S10
MFFHIKVSSKDKKVLENFGQFLSKLEMTSNFLKSFSKQNTRKFVTILKSPHVNKTAQEQFEFRFYTKEFVISSFKPLTFFLILKKVNNLSFSGMNLKVKSLFKRNEKKKVTAVNPDNTNLNTVKSHGLVQKKNLKQKMFNNKNFQTFDASSSVSKRYIQLFDCYGEMSLKNDFYLK